MMSKIILKISSFFSPSLGRMLIPKGVWAMIVGGLAGVAVVLSLAHTRTVFFPPGSLVLPSVVADDVEWQNKNSLH